VVTTSFGWHWVHTGLLWMAFVLALIGLALPLSGLFFFQAELAESTKATATGEGFLTVRRCSESANDQCAGGPQTNQGCPENFAPTRLCVNPVAEEACATVWGLGSDDCSGSVMADCLPGVVHECVAAFGGWRWRIPLDPPNLPPTSCGVVARCVP